MPPLDDFTAALLTEIETGWAAMARPSQLPPPGAWAIWLILAGRGWGKTRTGAEFVLSQVPTAADARDIMVEGQSGILAVAPPWFRPVYEPSKRRLTWPNGAIATTFSAEEADRLRGPQHDLAWCDEIAAWRDPTAWDMLAFGMRLGRNPQTCVTTTPRPTKLIRELVARHDIVVTRGSSYENHCRPVKQAVSADKAMILNTILAI
jgi:phage terminase large subunit-like protein